MKPGFCEDLWLRKKKVCYWKILFSLQSERCRRRERKRGTEEGVRRSEEANVKMWERRKTKFISLMEEGISLLTTPVTKQPQSSSKPVNPLPTHHDLNSPPWPHPHFTCTEPKNHFLTTRFARSIYSTMYMTTRRGVAQRVVKIYGICIGDSKGYAIESMDSLVSCQGIAIKSKYTEGFCFERDCFCRGGTRIIIFSHGPLILWSNHFFISLWRHPSSLSWVTMFV